MTKLDTTHSLLPHHRLRGYAGALPCDAGSHIRVTGTGTRTERTRGRGRERTRGRETALWQARARLRLALAPAGTGDGNAVRGIWDSSFWGEGGIP
jgi:hypothetical protein